MSDEDQKKTRRVETNPPEPEVTHTAAPTGTGGTGGLADASTGTEINQAPDRFTLAAVLGEGSQGEVCKAKDNLLERWVAIKFPHRVGDETTAREILVEARKAARLNHPNVVTIYEVGFWKNRPFIAMELVEGVSLATVLKEAGRISVDRYLRYARQILKALCAAHDSGLVHRDLKPHNVLLAADGTLKLTDFGVAHVHNEVSGSDSTVNVSIAGTPGYMAPEQWLGKKPDARSDIYAFGCMSYKLLAGQNVFPHEDAMQHHIETPPPRLRDIAPHVPENLDEILMRCLEKKPSGRFQSSEELLYAIDAAAQDEDAPGTAKWPAVEKSSRIGPILGLLTVLLVAAAGWLMFTRSGKTQFDKLAIAMGLREAVVVEDPESEAYEPSSSEIAQVENERRARELLAQAESAENIDDRLKLANQALQFLPAGTPERERAAALVVEAKAEKKSTTEKMVRTQFTGLLAEVRQLRSSGSLGEAGDKLNEAESLLENSPYLRQYSKELKEIKLPLLEDQAKALIAQGAFAVASDSYDESVRIADMLGRQGPRDRFRTEAEVCRKLGRLQKLAETQSAYVLQELMNLEAEHERLPEEKPAVLLLRARAWHEVGARNRARKAVVTFIEQHPDSPLRDQAQILLDSIER